MRYWVDSKKIFVILCYYYLYHRHYSVRHWPETVIFFFSSLILTLDKNSDNFPTSFISNKYLAQYHFTSLSATEGLINVNQSEIILVKFAFHKYLLIDLFQIVLYITFSLRGNQSYFVFWNILQLWTIYHIVLTGDS